MKKTVFELPQTIFDNLSQQRILIFGLGREGQSTYRFLRKYFPQKHITLTDEKPFQDLSATAQQIINEDSNAAFFIADNVRDQIEKYDLIFKSPGIPPASPLLVLAKEKKINITSQIELFFELFREKIIGVTGTKGKSTTSSMIFHILKTGGLDVRLAGNIGKTVLDEVDEVREDTIVVLELSSYQLSDLQKSPHIAVVQNIVPEHLNYHTSFEKYVSAKSQIARYQTTDDYFVFNPSFTLPTEMASLSPAHKIFFSLDSLSETGSFVEGKWLVYKSVESQHPSSGIKTPAQTGRKWKVESIIQTDQLPLIGEFNILNVLPGIAVGRLMGVSVENIASAIKSFRPLQHRLEFIKEVNGVSFYNDSLSTVPEAAMNAMNSFPDRQIILIAGGYDRGLDFKILAKEIVRKKLKAVILFPTTGQKIWQEVLNLKPPQLPKHHDVETMKEAVELSKKYAVSGDIVLLSPASPSFSVFKDYEDRGNQFRSEVEKLG